MKLNWFSPLPPAKTDIAHYTGRILSALAQHAQVTLWTDQAHWDARLSRHAEVRRFDPERMPWWELNRADLTVYNIGNNDRFHGGIWQTSVAHPGLVVLHDLHLHHFFAGLMRGRYNAQSEYLTTMWRCYGPRGWFDARRFCHGAIPGDEVAQRYPLTELAVQNGLGVVVHTQRAFEGVARLAPQLPAAYLPLPYEASRLRTLAGPIRRRPCRLIVFGYLGANRRLHQLLEALAALPERERFRLSIYGEVSDEAQVRSLVGRLNLRGLVRLHGYVPEEELDAALSVADVAVNLRYPTWGEASGSQLRIWDHALPSIVTRVGWYADLPKDSAVFVRPEREVADLQRALKEFLADPERYRRIGRNGRRVLEARHAPRSYVRGLVDFATKLARPPNRAVALKWAQRIGEAMRGWVQPHGGEKLLASAGRQIAALTGTTSTPRSGSVRKHPERAHARTVSFPQRVEEAPKL